MSRRTPVIGAGAGGFLILVAIVILGFAIAQKNQPTTKITVTVFSGRILNASVISTNVSLTDKWFNSYPNGPYTLLVENQAIPTAYFNLTNIADTTYNFYADNTTAWRCVNVYLYLASTNGLLDSKTGVCE